MSITSEPHLLPQTYDEYNSKNYWIIKLSSPFNDFTFKMCRGTKHVTLEDRARPNGKLQSHRAQYRMSTVTGIDE